MSRQFKDGKPYKPKAKAPRRKNITELVAEENIELFRQKINLLQNNIADEFLDVEIRDKKIYERAISLAELQQFELLIRLAATELHLETTLFLYNETYKQKEFLEDAYRKSSEKRLEIADRKSKGKDQANSKYIRIKETAEEILKRMDEYNFKLFGKKMRAKFPGVELPPSTLRKYFLDITKLKSTK